MLTTLAFLIVLLIAAVLVYAATRPDNFRVLRSVSIQAAPEKIFPFINDFRQWDAWTPYNKDPAMKKTYGGAASGVGATYAWEGNGQVGQGNIDICASTPPSMVALNLNMVKPFAAKNQVEFTLQPKGDLTEVTWAMDGQHIFIGKVMGLFMSMDNMVGKDFELGLAKLKTLAEK